MVISLRQCVEALIGRPFYELHAVVAQPVSLPLVRVCPSAMTSLTSIVERRKELLKEMELGRLLMHEMVPDYSRGQLLLLCCVVGLL